MEVCGVRNFHCDFLEGKVDGLAKSTLQFLRRRVETFQNSPLGLFAAGIFSQDLELVTGQWAFGKLNGVAPNPSFKFLRVFF